MYVDSSNVLRDPLGRDATYLPCSKRVNCVLADCCAGTARDGAVFHPFFDTEISGD